MVCIICYQPLFAGRRAPAAEAPAPEAAPAAVVPAVVAVPAAVAARAAENMPRNPPAALGCGHTFHKDCISRWFEQAVGARCPVCQERHTGAAIPLFIDIDDDEVTALYRRRNLVAGDVGQVDEMLARLALGDNADVSAATRAAVAQIVAGNAALQEQVDDQEEQIHRLEEAAEARANEGEPGAVGDRFGLPLRRWMDAEGRLDLQLEVLHARNAMLEVELRQKTQRVEELELSEMWNNRVSASHKTHIRAMQKKTAKVEAKLQDAYNAIVQLSGEVARLEQSSEDTSEVVHMLQTALEVATAATA
ncbi:hypothetical protein H4R19_000670 [Coemansia spiralis]|nr:hypothetical protein H4R19_000670 [Coemansia spiralis]